MNLTYSNKEQVKCFEGHPTHEYSYKSPLSIQQRAILAVTIIIMICLSIIGNVATLYVAIKRQKIRIFFRTCLISLACSDLISSLFTGVNFLTQFFSTFINIWYLGPFVCRLLPFLITTAILVNGITLVGISFDRYMAVQKSKKAVWEPNVKMCIFLAFIAWTASAAIATPSIIAYKYSDLFIFQEDSRNRSIIFAITAGHMCAANKHSYAIYYTVLFGFLFLPTFIAFLWFNSVLARQIWKRRKVTSTLSTISLSMKSMNQPVGSPNASGSNPKELSFVGGRRKQSLKPTEMGRQARQMKMFILILLLMFMYLAARMPEWIFLLLSFYDLYQSSAVNAVLLEFSFGILSLSSTVFNPILYAFLMQTVKYLIDLYHKTQSICLQICICLSSVIEDPGRNILDRSEMDY